MEAIVIPITLLISAATFLITVGGVWFVTQKRVRDLELKTLGHDKKFEQIITEISGLKTEMHDMKTEVNAEISGLRTDMNAEISSLRTDMNAEISSLRTDMNAEISSLRADMNAEISSLRADMNAEISDVKVEIAKMQGSVMVLSEKFDLFIHGRLIPATPSVAVVGA